MALNDAISLPEPEGRITFSRTLPGVLVIVVAYALVHATLRLVASGNLGDDDPLDNLLVQVLAPGYSLQHGPLYDWLLWAVQRFAGTGLPSFLLVKYACLVGMAGCLFLITRRITGSALWGFIAVESMASVYQIFWRFHEGFTHRVGAMALAVATFWALICVVDRGRRRDYVGLAVAVGLGLLTERPYVVFLCALLGAVALQPAIRRRLSGRRLLAVLPVVLLIVSPYAAWLLAEPQRLAEFAAAQWPARGGHSVSAMLKGLRDALTFPLFVLSPYVLIVPMVFPGIWRSIFRQTPLRPAAGAAPDFGQLLAWLLLIEFAYLLCFDVLLFPRSDYPVHSLLPMFVLAIAWLSDKARATLPSPKRVRVFMLVLAGFTVTAFLVRSGNLYVYDPFCQRCRWGVPYPDLAEQLKQRGFKGGTVVSDEQHIAANLRRFFPDSRFVVPGRAGEGLPAVGGQTLVIWSAGQPGEAGEPPPAELAPYLSAVDGVAPVNLRLSWRHLWKPQWYRESRWQYRLYEAPAAGG